MSNSPLASREFWTIFHEVLFDQERLAQTFNEVEQVLRLLKLADKARILDLACSFGRHSYALAEKGFLVTEVDLNKVLLIKLKNRLLPCLQLAVCAT